MTMLVASYRADWSGDIILAADGCRSVGSYKTNQWREEERREKKSVRLSEQCAVAFSAGSTRLVNCLLAHIFDQPSWADLPDTVIGASIIAANEEKYMRVGLTVKDLGGLLSSFTFPILRPDETGTGMTIIAAGQYCDRFTATEVWRFRPGNTERQYGPNCVLYSVFEQGEEPEVPKRLCSHGCDTEAGLVDAFSYAASKYPGRINANVGIRCLSEKFAFRWLNNSPAPY